jgi:hypothetical protein
MPSFPCKSSTFGAYLLHTKAYTSLAAHQRGSTARPINMSCILHYYQDHRSVISNYNERFALQT